MTRTTDFQSVAVCHRLRQCEFRLENPSPRIRLPADRNVAGPLQQAVTPRVSIASSLVARTSHFSVAENVSFPPSVNPRRQAQWPHPWRVKASCGLFPVDRATAIRQNDPGPAAGCHCWLAQQCFSRCNSGLNLSDNTSPPHRKQVRHFDEPGHVHELTFSCYRRRPLLVEDRVRVVFCEALGRAIQKHEFRLLAFVVMPEHVHPLVHPRTVRSQISELLFAIKRPSSHRIKMYFRQTAPEILHSLTIRQRPGVEAFRFWQEGPGYDRNLTTSQTILAAIDTIHLNPVRRGLCERAIDWKWSSARDHILPNLPSDPDLPQLTPVPPNLLL